MDSRFLGKYGTIAIILHGKTTQWWEHFAMHYFFSQLMHIMFTHSLQHMKPAWSESRMGICHTRLCAL